MCKCDGIDIEKVRSYASAAMIEAGHQGAELSILLADDAYVRQLNRRYRGVDRTTNVLAFPQQESSKRLPPTWLLGDVVISVEKARRDSEHAGHSLFDEIKKLMVHGIVHLSGYDHRTGSQGRRMRLLEQAIIEHTR